MSGTWAVIFPSGRPYSFHRTIDEANQAANSATRLQCQHMKVVLWK